MHYSEVMHMWTVMDLHTQFTTETDDTQDRQTTGHSNNTNNRLSLPNCVWS